MNNKNNSLENHFETRAKLLKNRMLKSNIAKPELIKGCSEKEISDLEKKCDVVFPESYKVFLRNFGHGLGGYVMNDIDILYRNIQSLTDLLRNEILIDEGDPVLPEKAFVFSGRYGEQFTFFDGSGLVKEPHIFYYMEYAKNFKKIGNSVFDLFESEIEATEYFLKHRKKK